MPCSDPKTILEYACHALSTDCVAAGDNYYDLLGVAFYTFNCTIGLLCSAIIFFLIELPAANLKNLIMPKVYAGIGFLLRRGKSAKDQR